MNALNPKKWYLHLRLQICFNTIVKTRSDIVACKQQHLGSLLRTWSSGLHAARTAVSRGRSFKVSMVGGQTPKFQSSKTALRIWNINDFSCRKQHPNDLTNHCTLEQVSFTRSAWYNARKGPKTAEAMAKHIECLDEICQKMLLHFCCCFLLRRFTKVAGCTVDAIGALHFVSKLPTSHTRG